MTLTEPCGRWKVWGSAVELWHQCVLAGYPRGWTLSHKTWGGTTPLLLSPWSETAPDSPAPGTLCSPGQQLDIDWGRADDQSCDNRVSTNPNSKHSFHVHHYRVDCTLAVKLMTVCCIKIRFILNRLQTNSLSLYITVKFDQAYFEYFFHWHVYICLWLIFNLMNIKLNALFCPFISVFDVVCLVMFLLLSIRYVI